MLAHRWVLAPLPVVALAAILAAASCGQSGAGALAHRPPSSTSPTSPASAPPSTAAPGPVASAVPPLATQGTPGPPAAAPAGQPGNSMSMYVTMYGWLDNSPPGAAIEHPVVHKQGPLCCAGGTGTYADPITFGTDEQELPVGTRVYVSSLRRYFVMEDSCDECSQDWTAQGPEGGPGVRRIEVWAGGDAQSGQALLDCELALGSTTPVPVILNPPPGLQVSSRPLFNAATRSCYRPGT